MYNEQNEIIGFCAVLHQPHNKVLNLKRIHRLVILPDYQGIGLGTQFLNIIAEHYNNNSFKMCIVTSAKNMIWSLYRSDKWRCTAYSASTEMGENSKLKTLNKSIRKVKCGRFMYKGGDE